MRSEQEMMDLILTTAREDPRIRAVMMNGSRVNPNAPRDLFQDYDIVYFVTDVAPFVRNLDWIARFGEMMILQMPEDMVDPPPENSGSFAYLMQFADGNRIDLGINPLSELEQLVKDSLTLPLLDKDNLFPPFDPPSDLDYLPKPPTAKLFADCCNEFWWVSPYVAKGLWREEITYAKHMFDLFVRDQLMKMIDWNVGIRTGFAQFPGKYGKYLRRYLDPPRWDLLMKTYADASYEHTWDALEAAGELFHLLAAEVAVHFGFDYNTTEEENVRAHLRHVRRLPRDAKSIY